MSVLPHWFIPSLLPLHLVETSNSNNYHLTIIITTPSIFNQHSPPTLPKSIHSTLPNFRPVRSLLTNTWRQDRLYPPNPPKLPHSSLYPRKMDPYVPAKTTGISTSTLFRTCTPYYLSQSSLMTWKMPPPSQSVTFNGATTTSTSVRRTSGKPPLSPPSDSSNRQ